MDEERLRTHSVLRTCGNADLILHISTSYHTVKRGWLMKAEYQGSSASVPTQLSFAGKEFGREVQMLNYIFTQ